MKLTFLGTSCMMPTPERNHPGVLLTWQGENILFDCGENMQRQLRIAGIPPTAITKILLTHWHGDHMLGLPGLLQSMIGNHYGKVLEIYGPKGIKQQLEALFACTLRGSALKVQVKEVVQDGVIFQNNDFQLEAVKVKHSVPCVSYAFQELPRRKMKLSVLKKLGIPKGPLFGKLQKGQDVVFENKKISADKVTELILGKRIAYVTDTSLVDACYVIAKDADVLMCESTFVKSEELKAKDTYHLTAEQAALIAKKAKVKKLALMHFSQRYKDTSTVVKEAAKVFKKVQAMNDFDVLEV
ncbi:MAG: ribonuclease Z [Nanoarchaeota archaeon]|nr:ribonuclease Z [Nanoarchaeota archaeon]